MRTDREVKPMRHNQRLTIAQLRQEAHDALKASGKSQVGVARDLGVSEGAISRALKEEGNHLADLQRRIIEHVTPYTLEKEPQMWRARKAG